MNKYSFIQVRVEMSVKETEKHVEYSEFDGCSTPAARDGDADL